MLDPVFRTAENSFSFENIGVTLRVPSMGQSHCDQVCRENDDEHLKCGKEGRLTKLGEVHVLLTWSV